MLTSQMVLEEMQLTTNVKHAIYLLVDGGMIDGIIERGVGRTVEHREVELFTTSNRYDDSFWDEVMITLQLVLVEPETKVIMVHPSYAPSEQQVAHMNKLTRFGYEVMEFK